MYTISKEHFEIPKIQDSYQIKCQETTWWGSCEAKDGTIQESIKTMSAMKWNTSNMYESLSLWHSTTTRKASLNIFGGC